MDGNESRFVLSIGKEYNMIIGNKEFDLEHHFYVMGILNVTPDSFSDGGQYSNLDDAFFQAESMIRDGAHILDVGGESTRPGHEKITDAEEIERIAPVIEGIKKRFDIAVSLDTYKSEVAKAGIIAGADMINDIWGLKWDRNMADVIANAGVACCLMHNRDNSNYEDLMSDVKKDIQESIDIARNAGIEASRIMIDPGIGFAKDLNQNLVVMNHLAQLKELGYPVLLGTSRKSMIGLTLDLPVNEREEGTMATSVMGLMAGCSVFRVHDVKKNLRALQMAEAILKA